MKVKTSINILNLIGAITAGLVTFSIPNVLSNQKYTS